MRCLVCWLLLSVLAVLLLVHPCNQQLIINVRNQGGEVLQETISANVSDDIVSLEFQRSDGTLVTQLIDFRNEVQIMRSLILGEEERGQSQYQVLCFIIHAKDAFISSDAMAKLRQKNPGTVRIPEEDRGRENYTLDYRVDVRRAAVLSPFVADLCSEARDSSYTREQDVQQWATLQGLTESTFFPMLKRFPMPLPNLDNNHLADEQVGAAQHPDELTSGTASSLPSCADTKAVWSQCQCHLELCIGWYPCGLKYCKGNSGSNSSSKATHTSGKDGGGNDGGGDADLGKTVVSYRCGIKTCRKCHMFSYYVDQKQLCLWDE